MAVLERRLQVLIDPERGELLERLAKTQGKSVAAVVREAVDDKLARAGAVKQAALERLLERAETPDERPSEDWPVIKAHIEEEMWEGLGA
ncbi:MAG: ribbon-helix-helix protein, CopG family [Propionibacteriaceae bacterium]|nr:ribbon-helix-helix protein, CopG family [Propionibacteriaceae bacterium]